MFWPTIPVFFAFLTVCVGLAFQGLSYPFVFDDVPLIEKNVALDLRLAGRYFLSFVGDSQDVFVGYRPLVWLSLALQKALWGLQPWTYRLVNAGLHALNATLLYQILCELMLIRGPDPVSGEGGGTKARHIKSFIMFTASLCFMMHPIWVNLIQLIWKRSDLLVCIGVFIGISSMLRQSPLGVMSGAFLALLSKENGGAFLPSLGIIALSLPADKRRILGAHRGLRWAIAAVTLLTGLHLWICLVIWPQVMAQAGLAHETFVPSFLQLDTASYLRFQSVAWIDYLRLAIWPDNLAIFHDLGSVDKLWTSRGVPATLVAIGVIGLSVVTFRQCRGLALGIAWVVLHLLPTALFPLNLPFDETRLYLPLAGVLIMISVEAWRRPSVWRPLIALASILLTFWAYWGVTYQAQWRSSEALWRHNVSAHPADPRPWLALGLTFDTQGRTQAAELALVESYRLDPAYPVLPYFLGHICLKLGRRDEAHTHFEESLQRGAFVEASKQMLQSLP